MKRISNTYRLVIDDALSAEDLAAKLRHIADKVEDYMMAGEGWNAMLEQSIETDEKGNAKILYGAERR